MIHLRDQDLIASSQIRNCYLHPSDHDKVIKVVRESAPLSERDANVKEWAHYLRLKDSYRQLNFISIYHGFVETNLGEGLLINCIRDYNGRISKRLANVLVSREQYNLVEVERVLDKLCQKIVKKNIQLFDMNKFNILIQILPDGKYHPVVVDIKGRYNNYELIPVSTYIPFFSRMKLKRRCNRLIKTVQGIIK